MATPPAHEMKCQADMVVGEEDGDSELLEEAWLSDVDSDADGNSESGDGLSENLQRRHTLEETKSIVGQHLQLRLEALRSEEESWGELAEVPPRLNIRYVAFSRHMQSLTLLTMPDTSASAQLSCDSDTNRKRLKITR